MTQEKVDTLIEVGKVTGVVGVATTISIANVNQWLTFVSIMIAICYGLRKWYLMEKRHNNGK